MLWGTYPTKTGTKDTYTSNSKPRMNMYEYESANKAFFKSYATFPDKN